MKTFSRYIVMALLLLVAVACNSRRTNDNRPFTVTCVASGVQVDSVSLYIVENEVSGIRLLGGARVKGGMVQFSGQIDSPHIAFLRIAGTREPFYFILEQCDTRITLTDHNTVVWGGPVNHQYFSLVTRRAAVFAAIKRNNEAYLRLCADSTLTQEREWQLLRTDSLLRDSVQMMTLHVMQQGGVVGRLTRDQYFNRLDTAHVRLLLDDKPQ